MAQYPSHEQGELPPTLGYATPQGAKLRLRQVAMQQRAINLCILAEIIIVIAEIAARGFVPILAMLMSLLYVGVAITGAVFLFMLAMSLYNTGAGIVLGILALVPILGLLILLVVNGKATKVLRQHGIRVGLLGADPTTIPVDG